MNMNKYRLEYEKEQRAWRKRWLTHFIAAVTIALILLWMLMPSTRNEEKIFQDKVCNSTVEEIRNAYCDDKDYEPVL